LASPSSISRPRIPRERPAEGNDGERTREGGGTGTLTQSPLLVSLFHHLCLESEQ
jgi:hypothetical protein